MAKQVNTFLANNQSLVNFNAKWILVAQWMNVCPFAVNGQPCAATDVRKEMDGMYIHVYV